MEERIRPHYNNDPWNILESTNQSSLDWSHAAYNFGQKLNYFQVIKGG